MLDVFVLQIPIALTQFGVNSISSLEIIFSRSNVRFNVLACNSGLVDQQRLEEVPLRGNFFLLAITCLVFACGFGREGGWLAVVVEIMLQQAFIMVVDNLSSVVHAAAAVLMVLQLNIFLSL